MRGPRCNWLGRCDRRRLIGVDVSARMLAEVRKLGKYAALVHAAFLRGRDQQSDVIAAGDVFPFVGPLDDVIGLVAHALRPDGRLILTVDQDATLRRIARGRRLAGTCIRPRTSIGCAERRISCRRSPRWCGASALKCFAPEAMCEVTSSSTFDCRNRSRRARFALPGRIQSTALSAVA